MTSLSLRFQFPRLLVAMTLLTFSLAAGAAMAGSARLVPKARRAVLKQRFKDAGYSGLTLQAYESGPDNKVTAYGSGRQQIAGNRIHVFDIEGVSWAGNQGLEHYLSPSGARGRVLPKKASVALRKLASEEGFGEDSKVDLMTMSHAQTRAFVRSYLERVVGKLDHVTRFRIVKVDQKFDGDDGEAFKQWKAQVTLPGGDRIEYEGELDGARWGKGHPIYLTTVRQGPARAPTWSSASMFDSYRSVEIPKEH
jgi:hypothetical protein